RQIGVCEAGREDGAQLDAVATASVDNRVATLQRNFQRLFDYDVLACFGRSHCRFHVRAAWRANDYNLDVAAREDGTEICLDIAGKTKFLGHFSSVCGGPAN